jgi:hypothetical protein
MPDLESFKTNRIDLATLDRQLLESSRQIELLNRKYQQALRSGAAADVVAVLNADVRRAIEARRAIADSHKRARIDLSGVAGQVFIDPDVLTNSLSTDYPVALFPVRIETRFKSSTELQIRVYPDQVHIHQHAAGITEAEAAAARSYWTAWADLESGEKVDAVWKAVAAKLGPERVKYVIDRFQPANLADLAPGIAPVFPDVPVVVATVKARPVARLLPSRWLVEITGTNGMSTYRGWFDHPVSDDLPVSPIGDSLNLPSADDAAVALDDPSPEGYAALSEDDAARWLIDFDKAVDAGMATTVRLQAGTFDAGISRLTVVGIDLSRVPEEASHTIFEHLRDHGYSDGFGLLKPGVPSNNSSAAPSEYRSGNRERASKVATTGSGKAAAGTDLGRLFYALGIADSTDPFVGFPESDLCYGDTVQALQTALWGASFGFYLGQFIAPLMPEETIGAVRGLVRDHLRPAGPLPTLRVGRQPYGVLPVLPPRTEVMRAHSLEGGFDKALPEVLERIRTYVECSRVAGPNGEESPIKPLDSIANLTHQPAGASSADVLTKILKLGPISTRINIRPTAGPVAMKNSNKADDASRKLHEQIVELIFASLGFPPQTMILQGQRPPLFDLAVQTWPAYRLHDMSWVTADLDAPAAMAAIVDKVNAQIQAARADPESLLSIGPNDAASLLEGLLMLSAAFEYWNAGERHIRDLAVAETTIGQSVIMPEMVGFSPVVAPPQAGAPIAVETPRQMLQLAGAATDNRPLLDFIDSVIHLPDPPPPMRDVKAFNDAMGVLRGRPAWEVDHALRGLLDLGSHRLDAFITSVATRRLANMRSNKPAGVYIGGYGVVHDLRRETTPDSEGYIHLPSTDHAITASILRAGHMANRDDDPNAFAVRLTSARVRNAIEISEGMARGQSPSALLGYRFERWLLDDKLRAQYIQPFRKVAPQATDGSPGHDPVDTIAAHDVADGVALVRMWMKDNALPLAKLEAVIKHSLPAGDREALKRHLTQLADIFDAFSDLWTAEAVHQLMRGNMSRSAAAMAVVDRQEKPADSQVVMTPRSAWGYTQRVFWMAEPGAADAWPRDFAAEIGAGANAIAAGMLGDPGRFAISVHVVDGNGVPLPDRQPATLGIADLGLSALSLILMSEPGVGAGEQASQLEEMIAAAVGQRPEFRNVSVAIGIEPPPDAATMFGFGKLLGLLDAIRRALVGRRSLTRRDFALASSVQEEGLDLAALAGTSAKVRAAVDSAAQKLTAGVNEEGLVDRASVLTGLAACVPLMMRLPTWVLTGSNAVTDDVVLATGRLALKSLDKPVVDWAQAGTDDPAEKEINRIRSVLGKDFPVLPEITLAPDSVGEWRASLADQAALNGGLGRRAVSRWRRQMAMVRGAMRALLDAVDAAALTEHRNVGETVSLAQFPHKPGARWAGLAFEKADGAMKRPELSMSAVVFGNFDPAKPVCGVLIDEWTEAIPDRRTATSISFQYDAPAARPPQSILLAVTPQEKTNWSADTLVDIVNEALDLARLRLLAPNQIPGAGAVLPTTFIPSNMSGALPSWQLLKGVIAQRDDVPVIWGKS